MAIKMNDKNEKVTINNIEIITRTREVDLPVLNQDKIQKDLKDFTEKLINSVICSIDITGMVEKAVKDATKDLVINNAVKQDVVVNNAVIKDLDSNIVINMFKNALKDVTDNVKVTNAIVEDVYVKHANISEIPKEDVLKILDNAINKIMETKTIIKPVFEERALNGQISEVVEKVLNENIKQKELTEYKFIEKRKDDYIFTPVIKKIVKMISAKTGEEIDV